MFVITLPIFIILLCDVILYDVYIFNLIVFYVIIIFISDDPQAQAFCQNEMDLGHNPHEAPVRIGKLGLWTFLFINESVNENVRAWFFYVNLWIKNNKPPPYIIISR